MKISNFLCPKFKTKLVRLGRENDGGYCVPEESITNTKILYSMGLNDDWSFEKDFLLKNTNVKIFSFDMSVNNKFWIKNGIINIINFLKFKKGIYQFFEDALCYFRYLIFFSKKNVSHIKKNIIEFNNNNLNNEDELSTTIKSFLSFYGNKNYSMKIDIEGNEFRILEDILKNQDGLEFLVMEFHNVDLMESHIKNFLKEIKLNLVHVHVNNYGGINKNGFAKVVEVTLSNKKYNTPREQNDFIFPDPLLDQPNNPSLKDSQIRFID